MAVCSLCGKGPVAGHNVPKSQHKTNRLLQPNVQKVHGVRLCTRCLRTIRKAQAGSQIEPLHLDAVLNTAASAR